MQHVDERARCAPAARVAVFRPHRRVPRPSLRSGVRSPRGSVRPASGSVRTRAGVPCDDGVEVVDCECEMADARGCSPARAGRRPGPTGRGTSSARAVRGRPGSPSAVHPTPSTVPSPCSLSPSSTKNAFAAARSSTTMPTWSMRSIVMRSTVAEALDQQRHTRVSGTEAEVETPRGVEIEMSALASIAAQHGTSASGSGT
jgi:hypothetical protein